MNEALTLMPQAALWPLLITVCGAAAVLLLTVSSGAPSSGAQAPEPKSHLVLLGVLTLLAAAAAVVASDGAPAFSDSIAFDGTAKIFAVVVCLGAALSLVCANAYLTEHGLASGEFTALLLLATSGALTVTCAQDLLVLFLGVELMSIAAYVLAGFRRAVRRSQEAALKYFFYGAFASAVMVFGMALVWGEIGLSQGDASLKFSALAKASQLGPQGFGALGWVGSAMVLCGLAFKIAAAPFHMWAPDVYEGAPTPSGAFLSVVVKTAAFSGFARLLVALFASGQRDLETVTQVIEALALTSVIVGNVLAMRQKHIKRMLAYSSVAHVGYLLTGLCALPQGGSAVPMALGAAAFYLFAYAPATVGAFAVVSALEPSHDRRVDVHIDRLSGAGQSYPGLACAMAVFMLALAGIPPMAGFVGKVGLFACSLSAGRTPLTLAAAIMSVVGAFYYLRVLGVMFMGPVDEAPKALQSPWLTVGLWACVALTLAQGLWPQWVMGPMQQALMGL